MWSIEWRYFLSSTSEEFIQKSRLVPSKCGEHVLNIRHRQSRIIVPAGRLMKELESSKHKFTHVSMQKKAPVFPTNALRGQRREKKPPLRWRPLLRPWKLTWVTSFSIMKEEIREVGWAQSELSPTLTLFDIAILWIEILTLAFIRPIVVHQIPIFPFKYERRVYSEIKTCALKVWWTRSQHTPPTKQNHCSRRAFDERIGIFQA